MTFGPLDDPPRDSLARTLAIAAVGGTVATLVSEVGQGVREYLRERRQERREREALQPSVLVRP